eukprot:6180799-Pleurochrysis_carterae.AAC.4
MSAYVCMRACACVRVLACVHIHSKCVCACNDVYACETHRACARRPLFCAQSVRSAAAPGCRTAVVMAMPRRNFAPRTKPVRDATLPQRDPISHARVTKCEEGVRMRFAASGLVAHRAWRGDPPPQQARPQH